MVDPFLIPAVKYQAEDVDGGGYSGAASPGDIAGGGLQTMQPPQTMFLPAPDGNPNRFQGRLRHGRGLPPGQQRKMGGLAQRWQQAGGAFEPGWRKQARQMQGGMQSLNGGGYQDSIGAARTALRGLGYQGEIPQQYKDAYQQQYGETMEFAAGTPQRESFGGQIPQQYQSAYDAYQKQQPDWGSVFDSTRVAGAPQPYRSPGLQSPPQQPFGAGATTWENSMSNPAAHEAIRNWYANQGGMTSWVPDQGMNQVAPQRQMVDRSAYFDPFVGPF